MGKVSFEEMWGVTKLAVGVVAVLIIISYGLSSISYEDRKDVVITVKKVWPAGYGAGSRYLFSDTNGTVYSIQDSTLKGIYNSAERYGMLEEGKTYRVEIFGKRVSNSFSEQYPNVIRIEEVGNTSVSFFGDADFLVVTLPKLV